MKLHLIIDASPESSDVRPAHSDTIREALEGEVESISFEVDGEVYLLAVLGSGKSAVDATRSMQMRAGGAR